MQSGQSTNRRIAPLVFVAMALPIGGCGTSRATLDRLAAAGAINEAAPIKTRRQIRIAAPPARVWTLLVNARSWPEWQNDIQTVTAAGPLAPGTRFSWKTGGMQIDSRVQLCEPQKRLSWTGTAWTAKAVHVWELASETGAQTVVTCTESMDGPFMAHLFSSQQLAESSERWLSALKNAAEQRQ